MSYLIDRQQAIDALKRKQDDGKGDLSRFYNTIIQHDIETILGLPPAVPDKDKVSDLLYHIYSIESPHLDMSGVIAKKYYCEELWKELFGKESKLPRWMT